MRNDDDDETEMRAINEKLVIASVRQHELAEIAQQAERRAEAALNELRAIQEHYKHIAVALQRPMLFQPNEDAFSGLMVQTAYAMASEEALVGGDFWDTAYDHGHVAFVLGNVMGHGLSSAIFTTELKHTMRGYIREHEQPGRILFQMNEFVCQATDYLTKASTPKVVMRQFVSRLPQLHGKREPERLPLPGWSHQLSGGRLSGNTHGGWPALRGSGGRKIRVGWFPTGTGRHAHPFHGWDYRGAAERAVFGDGRFDTPCGGSKRRHA